MIRPSNMKEAESQFFSERVHQKVNQSFSGFIRNLRYCYKSIKHYQSIEKFHWKTQKRSTNRRPKDNSFNLNHQKWSQKGLILMYHHAILWLPSFLYWWYQDLSKSRICRTQLNLKLIQVFSLKPKFSQGPFDFNPLKRISAVSSKPRLPLKVLGLNLIEVSFLVHFIIKC